jgi:glyoxylase-like metal-dependent hydrolase (beta-lactamase superfamily II)
MSRIPLVAALVFVLCVISLGADRTRQGVVRTADPAKRGLAESDFPRAIKLADNVYAYEDLRSAGAERFTTVSFFVVTSEGVLVADGQGSVEATKRLVDTIARLTPQPIRYVVICSDHGDHTGGNRAFPSSATFIAHPTSKAALEAQAARRGGGPPPGLPSETVPDKRVMRLGGTEIQILFLGRAHTGGDLSVYLPRERILFMSEAYLNRVFPAMRSAYPSEWVRVVDAALKMDVGTYLPGHGFVEAPAASREELVNYRRALEAVVAEVTRHFRAGVPAAEAVKKVNWGPFAEWRLSASQGPIAVNRIYEELQGKLAVK